MAFFKNTEIRNKKIKKMPFFYMAVIIGRDTMNLSQGNTTSQDDLTECFGQLKDETLIGR